LSEAPSYFEIFKVSEWMDLLKCIAILQEKSVEDNHQKMMIWRSKILKEFL